MQKPTQPLNCKNKNKELKHTTESKVNKSSTGKTNENKHLDKNHERPFLNLPPLTSAIKLSVSVIVLGASLTSGAINVPFLGR